MATFINTSLTAPSVTKDTFTFNNDSNYFVNATVGDISQNTITFGDGSRDQVTAAGDISQNTITFGNGGDDNVRALGISKSIITFGNGAFDEVIAGGSIDHNTITFGDILGVGGDRMLVIGNSSHDRITFGDGFQDSLQVDGSIDHDTITFGDGLGPQDFSVLIRSSSSYDTFTFGNGGRDSVVVDGNSSHDTFTFGDGARDLLAAGSIDHDTIILGNGDLDVVSVGGSAYDLIIVGNGNFDHITLNSSGTAIGGDTIVTGTGSDAVQVGAHTNPDTFGLSLGTTGTSFTTITGAQAGDHVAVGNSAGIVLTDPNGLGSTLIQAATTATTLASYITSLGPLTNGDTYVGFNKDPTVNATFIVTQSGQIGAVELVGHAFDHNSIAGHFLTLA